MTYIFTHSYNKNILKRNIIAQINSSPALRSNTILLYLKNNLKLNINLNNLTTAISKMVFPLQSGLFQLYPTCIKLWQKFGLVQFIPSYQKQLLKDNFTLKFTLIFSKSHSNKCHHFSLLLYNFTKQ